MTKSFMKYIKGSVLVIFATYAVMISSGFVFAGDFTMQKYLTDIAELMSKWSKQLSSGKMDAQSQAKLSELLARTSEVLQELSAQKSSDMNMNHHMKIEQMKKEWDPFDTSDRM